MVGFGFNGPLRQYFSLYRAVSQREGERGEKIDESKNVQTTRTYCKHNRPLLYCNQNCRTPRHWKFIQHNRTTRPPPNMRTHRNSKSRKENPQKLTQLSSSSHPRHLVGKRTALKDTIIDITSDSQANSNFPNRWSPASLTFNNYFYLFLYLYIT